MTSKPRSGARRFIAGPVGAALGLSACLAIAVSAQERDRSKIPDSLKWNLADIYASDTAWRGAKEAFAAELPTLGRFKGRLTATAGLAGRWPRPPVRPRQGAVAALRLREHGSRSGYARQPARGHAAGDDAAGGDVRRAGRLHRAGGPEGREGGGRAVPRLGAAAEGVPRLSRRHPAPRGPHAHRHRREAPRRRGPAGPGAVGDVTTFSRTRTSRIRPSR